MAHQNRTDQHASGSRASVISGAPPGAGQPPPAPLGRRDITYSILQLPVSTLSTEVIENAAADYALDAGFSLTRFVGVLPLDPPVPASYQINTSTVAESAANSAIVMRWGRWAGGDITITDATGTLTQSLAQQSLHWIETGNQAAAPVMPVTSPTLMPLNSTAEPTSRPDT